ncbi:NAD(P)/FAD-dependent oxidoreductase [Roseateles amylovorans]|uniref:NAD(P)/FAD-dependent oxidoreductase n=1 Tax=Roseateles amylovorans TaxID=2978473 RepID=A0ABY6B6L5_9BURK|nr:NAD(P)/FAD-dependent oxidoreductase [Roseateles amylovorans]UXH81020.1 NAD(P)/FAD-dependent oxidoreductase [Roseateles amylovorans]
MRRRDWLAGTGATGAALGLSLGMGMPLPARAAQGLARARVIVVGGGIGGTTAARYLRMWSGGRLEVVLIEPQADFVSCPMSNLVLGGFRALDDLRRPLDSLQRQHGVQLIRDRVRSIDTRHRLVLPAQGAPLRYDRLVLSPGIDLDWGAVRGLEAAHDEGRVLQAWKAGPETLALRRQIEALPDGGVLAITIPEAPYRCPPGPYERASVVAAWLKRHRPRAKLLVFDANPDITSKAALFRKVWAEQYAGLIEYRPLHKAIAVDAGRDTEGRSTVRFELQEPERVDLLNLLPPMRAGSLARETGLTGAAGRWCEIDYQTFAATAAPDIHVIGDAIQVAPAMPKSGHMANAHAKVAAAAVIASLAGWEPDPAPMLTNTCYSHVDGERVIHVASVHRYLAGERTYRAVPGSGGVSDAPNALEARYAWHWARTLWADMLG